MQLKYFSDTDTLHVILTDHPVVETSDLNDNVSVDLDKEGKVVSMTVEHAQQKDADLNISYQTISSSASASH